MRTVLLQFVFLLIAFEIRQVFVQKCSILENPAHGRVKLRSRGRIAKFRCNRTYKLFGKKRIICSGDKWNLPPPVCIHVEPENYCDFEDENICGWQHDKLANFEWKWNSGTTPTRHTGPTYDHTFGKGGNGHYMFMESSSPIKINDTARLLSQYYPATTGGLCFEIWYHMWGVVGYNQVGRSKIYIEDMGQTDTLSQTANFEVSGNQGDEWIKGQFPVGERKTFFRIIIEGTKLKSYLSDIAVDDPKLYNCSDDYTDSTLRYLETTAIDTTESVVQTTTIYHRPFETTEVPSSLTTTVTRLVKTTDELAASPTDTTDSTLSYQETTAIDTTKSGSETTTIYRRPIETTEASSSLATTVTRLVKTEELAASPTDDMDITRSNQEITAINTTEAVAQNPTQNVLMIGIGVGIVISLMTVTSTIYAYHKKRRKHDVFEDKEEPIARKYLFEIYKYGKDSDVDYHFET